MNIIFLGTSSMIPTKERNHTSVLLNYKAENILIDCGEGTQRQLRTIGIPPTKITKLLITHWHSDHILGIPGLIQTLNANNYSKTLEIYGPKKTKHFINSLFDLFLLEKKIKFKVTEIKKDIFYKDKDFILKAKQLKHTSNTLAYSFIEKDRRKINLNYTKKFGLTKHPLLGHLQKGKDITFKGKIIKVDKATKLIKGKKITFIYDTTYHNSYINIAKNSDLLICEATFSSTQKDLAKKYKHLTAEQAALIAKKSNSKQLILTHFSQRYKDLDIIKKEAEKIFKNVKLAQDFMKIEL